MSWRDKLSGALTAGAIALGTSAGCNLILGIEDKPFDPSLAPGSSESSSAEDSTAGPGSSSSESGPSGTSSSSGSSSSSG